MENPKKYALPKSVVIVIHSKAMNFNTFHQQHRTVFNTHTLTATLIHIHIEIYRILKEKQIDIECYWQTNRIAYNTIYIDI